MQKKQWTSLLTLIMKTGFDLTVSDEEDDDDELAVEVMALVCAFVDRGVAHAADYVEHSGRTVVTPRDMSKGLKLEVFYWQKSPYDRAARAELNKEWVRKLLDEDYSTDEDESDEKDEEEEEEEEEEDVVVKVCECELCADIRKIEDLWEVYVPTTEMERIVKRRIDEMVVEINTE